VTDSKATMLRQYEALLEEAIDDESIFAAKMADAQRRRKYWQRRLSEETGDGDRYDFRGEVPVFVVEGVNLNG
jgi:hypothetical protein